MDCVLWNRNRSEPLTDCVRWKYIQLPNFRVEDSDLCVSDIEKITYLMNNMGNMTTSMPFASSSVEFRRMEELCRLANMDSKERSLYERELKYYRDKRNQIEYAAKIGLEEGRAKGLAEGRAEGLAEGRAEGRAEGLAEGRAEGLAEGRAEGRAEGLEEGRAKGLAEGLAEGQALMIKAMMDSGMTLNQISSMLGMEDSEIRSLISR